MLRKWFVSWYGEGEAHQADLYRCLTCARLITWKRIRAGRTCCAGRIVPTEPRFVEKVRLMVLPWTI